MASMRPKTLHNGELWVRCPFCGDSKRNSWKAHFSVAVRSGLYYCFRCGTTGKFSGNQVMELLYHSGHGIDSVGLEMEIDQYDLNALYENLLPGPAIPRKTRAKRYNTAVEGVGRVDVFEMFHPDRSLSGILQRAQGYSRVYGERGLIWPSRAESLSSSQDNPIRVVEGPYDIQDDRTFAVSGLITFRALEKFFRYQYLILTPDGDIWTKPDLTRQFIRLLKKATLSTSFKIAGVEIISGGRDPDEVDVKDRSLINPDLILEKVRPLDI